MSVLLIIMNFNILLVNRNAGIIMSAYVAIYLVISLFLFFIKRSNMLSEMVKYASDYSQVQRQLIKEMFLPYAVLDEQGHFLWGNDEFFDIIRAEKATGKNIHSIIPDITKDKLPQDALDKVLRITLYDRDYKVVMRRINVENLEEEDSNVLITVYLYDETEINAHILEAKEQQMIVGLLYIDNYEEALESIDEVRRSLLIALIDRKINKYMQSMDAIIKKLEKDKYVFMFKNKYLPQMESSRFALLEEVRAINIGNEMAVTLSMGLGVNSESYLREYEFARVAMDLALGRGGDQAVVKTSEKISYYGGKSVQVEKKTRVKARVKAHALKELVEAKERVVIMGHSIGDVDSFGASVGVYRIAKTLGRKANIVINEVTTSVRPIMNRFLRDADYEDDMFLTSSQAKEIVDNNTLLVVVDVNRPNYTECKELLNLTRTIVVLDHHRQTGEAITDAVLSYIEPYASSACEMVAEVLQYIDDRLKLRQVEADAMYSGIMIDTNNFLTKTGVRTFEAAAFLRRSGADITKIRKIFRSDMTEYKLRAEAVHHMEIYKDCYAITECRAPEADSPTVLGAQVANELLNISNVKASFVLTEYNHKIYISARSIDEVNVQMVMEKLGGGGHMSVAGAQITDCNVERAKQMVKDTLRSMVEHGEI